MTAQIGYHWTVKLEIYRNPLVKCIQQSCYIHIYVIEKYIYLIDCKYLN